jgi:hypothetical protein
MSNEIVIRANAGHMRERATRFRTDFVRDHLNGQLPLTFADALRQATIRPSSDAEMILLVRRGALEFQGAEARNSGRSLSAEFQLLFNTQTMRIVVTLPDDIVVQCSDDGVALKLAFAPGIMVTFLDKPQVGGVEVPVDTLGLNTISISDSLLLYQSTQVGGQEEQVRFELNLDEDTPRAWRGQESVVTERIGDNRERRIFSVLLPDSSSCMKDIWRVYQIDTSSRTCGITRGSPYTQYPGARQLGQYTDKDAAVDALCDFLVDGTCMGTDGSVDDWDFNDCSPDAIRGSGRGKAKKVKDSEKARP